VTPAREHTIDLIVARIVDMELEVFGDHLSMVQLRESVSTLMKEEPIVKALTAEEGVELDRILATVLLPTFTARERDIARVAARAAFAVTLRQQEAR
jgi:hypothetical protein